MTDAALLGLVDAVAWQRSVVAGELPAVDLPSSWEKLSQMDFGEMAVDPRVRGSKLLQHVVDLEHLRRTGKIACWRLKAVEDGGVARVDLVSLAGTPKMVVLRAA